MVRGQYLASVKIHLPRMCRIFFFNHVFSVQCFLQTQEYSIDLWSSQMFSKRLVMLTCTIDTKKGENGIKPLNKHKSKFMTPLEPCKKEEVRGRSAD